MYSGLEKDLETTKPELDVTLSQVRRMDPGALGELHDRLYPEVYRYVRYRLNDEQACEDIASDVFLNLLEALQQKRGLNLNLRLWLLGMASTLVDDYLREQFSFGRGNPEPGTGEHLAQEGLSRGSRESLRLRRMVTTAYQQLTPEQQHILALRFAEDRSLEETIAISGKTVGAVTTLQHSALASLRSLLVKDRQSI